MNSNRGLWITLLVLLLIVCCCCCALAWGAGSLALGGIRMGASAIGPDSGGWERWFRSWENDWFGPAAPWQGFSNAQASESIQQTLTVAGPATLDLSVPVGDVTVKTGPAGEVTVEGTKRAYGATEADAQRVLDDIQVKIDQSGDKVWVRVSGQFMGGNSGRSPLVDLEITVPKQTTVTANVGVGRLQVSGTEGDAMINADVGDVILTDIMTLFVKTRVSSVDFSGALAANGKYEITTDIGKIALRVPANSAFTIDARSDIGDVNVDGFPVSGSTSREALVGEQVQGDVGENPTASLMLRSRVGEISVNPGR
ncbi:MAG: DUF4097 domain-containing protein [Anaerolineae bacterium]|nr:DUF4097 domain-containing protein [Anaerolineae bacterium]